MNWPLPLELDPDPPGWTYPTPPDRPRVVCYGDSFTQSYGAAGPSGWPALCAAALGIETVNMAVSSSGYVDLGNGTTFPHSATVNPQPDAAAAVVMGSQNDQAQNPDAVHLAAIVTYGAITVRAPGVRLLVVGPFWYDDDPPRNLWDVRDAVRDAADGAGAAWLDPLAGRWLTARPGLILQPNGMHPNLAGQAAIADRVRPALAALL